MPVDAPKLEAITLLAAKAEVDTGVAETLTATEAAIIVYDWQCTPDDNTNPRRRTGAFGANASKKGLQTGTMTFEVDLAGNGSAGQALWASTFLPACNGTLSTATWSFLTRTNTTLTMMGFEDGMRRGLVGARGTFRIFGEAGGIARVAFTFQGRYVELADTTQLAPTFPTVLPPSVDGSTFTFDSSSPIVSRFEIDVGGDVQIRRNIGSTGGVRAGVTANTLPTFSFDPEDLGTASYDWRTKRDSEVANLAFSLAIGSATNNKATIASSTAQLLGVPRENRNGVLARNVTGQFTGAGFTLVLD